ncbi:glycosyltransferase family 4 protein [Methylicorpusculum oleiharenae]|uniref:glycosyltransferase family 4 protein n=1 Tax=Methylicorpusculum oleiharenae TaxID=1338687 RepID=UPI0013593D7D|nr:glycosyltransferase family 4 protein [Methylicorpusculum oleiharenae]MCD2448925.1 glycosyltransferase family 4 protein [Methylicorpusculum oleiharenae]
MRILIIQNHYIGFGGDDVVVAAETSLLQSKGHEVSLWSLRNDDLTHLRPKIETALNLTYNHKVKAALAKHIAKFRPDVMHCHNLFPRITPAAYDAAREANVPIVQTLHDFRSFCCAGAFLYRKELPCELCVTGSSYWGAWHRCYRGSWVGSLVLSHTLDFHRRHKTLQRQIQRFIAPSEASKYRFVAAGLPDDRIIVKPNFIKDPGYILCENRKGALFAGRLSPEKGITTLIKAWEHIRYPLSILGNGPLMKNLQRIPNPCLTFLGHQPNSEVGRFMSQAEFLVMPSEWIETFGMVIVEAFAYGLPVIASRLGAMAEIIDDGVTGLHFISGDANDLAAKVNWAISHPERMAEMGVAARRVYEARYNEHENYRQLIQIYESAQAKV